MPSKGLRSTLTSADPAALREYLLGQFEFRQGRWPDAYDDFQRAVQIEGRELEDMRQLGAAEDDTPPDRGVKSRDPDDFSFPQLLPHRARVF